MSIIDVMQEYEKKILHRVSFLENRVKELEAENIKLNEQAEKKYFGLCNFVLNRIKAPEGLEFDGRDFITDLRALVIQTIERRESGKWKSFDDAGRLIPFIPDTGHIHMWLDKDAGFKNFPTLEETRAHVDRRHLWVLALLNELTRIL